MLTSGVTLVTGATGFVGRHCVRALLARGTAPAALRLLVRDPARAAALGLPPDALVAGSLQDAAALERCTEGVALTIHLAGTLFGLRAADYLEVNRDGTRRLVAALLRSAPGSRLVHVSSLAAASPSCDGAGSTFPPEQCRPVSLYGESKRQGELAVAAAGERLSWIVLRPPILYGPDDAATRVLFRAAVAPLALVPWRPLPLSVMHVDDLVEAVLRAGAASARGVCIPLEGPERTDSSALVRALAQACGRRARVLPVPLALARFAAAGADHLARLRRRPFSFSSDKLRELCACGWVADPAPARELLGFSPRVGLAQGLRRTACAEGWAARAADAPR
jgi:nucleoside-diphosphate-sugar epimerase